MNKKKKVTFSTYLVIGYRIWGSKLAKTATLCDTIEQVEDTVYARIEQGGAVAVFMWNAIKQAYELETDWNAEKD